MPQISVWQCDHTKKVFASKADYLTHLRGMARVRYNQRTRQKYSQESRDYIQSTLRRCGSFEDIADWFLDGVNNVFLIERHNRLHRSKVAPDFHFETMTFKPMDWFPDCNNAHYAPDGELINPDRVPMLPRYYPGCQGYVEFTFTTEFITDGVLNVSSLFEGTGIHLGAGGGGNGRRKHSVTIFDQDFPILSVMRRVSA